MTSGGPLSLWQGWDARGGASSRTDLTESFAAAGASVDDADVRYELIAVAQRGFRPPRFLRVLEFAQDHGDAALTELSAEADLDDQTFRQAWSACFRCISETAPQRVAPYAIYLLGVNPPDGASADELRVFNDFYSDVHVPEVAERRHALRAVRYEHVRDIRAPYQGTPRYLATYEVDEAGASSRRHVGPPYSAGPEVWRAHATPWRLWYRRLGAVRDE